MTGELVFVTAFVAGLVSFFSPCVFPLLPLYIAIIAPKDRAADRLQTFKAALSFIAGFTLVFILLGVTASAIGSLLMEKQDVLRKIGGVFMVVMGFMQLGILPMGGLLKEWRPFLNKATYGTGGAFFLGMAFVFGWVPCTGPVLASILMYAGVESSLYQGAFLLLAYSAGFSLPLLLVALAAENISRAFKDRMLPYLELIQKVSGVILIVIGIMLYFDWLARVLGMLL